MGASVYQEETCLKLILQLNTRKNFSHTLETWFINTRVGLVIKAIFKTGMTKMLIISFLSG